MIRKPNTVALPEDEQDDDESLTGSNLVSSFGVGCFHFTPKDGSADAYDLEVFPQQIRECLEQIPNINNVEITGYESFIEFSTSSDHDDIAYRRGVYPNPVDTRIEFDLYIPKRLQEKHNLGREVHTDTESFHIIIAYEDYLPVTIVKNLDGGWYSIPSQSIVIIREYISEAIQNLPSSSSVKFEFLGPSPFHADFYVSRKLRDTMPVIDKCIIRKNPGYDDVIFQVSAKENTDQKWIESLVINQIVTEINFYYFIVQFRNNSLRLSVDIEDCLNQLRDQAEKEKNILSRFLEAYKMKRMVQFGFFKLYDLELNMIEMTRVQAQRKKEVSDMGIKEYLREYTEYEVRDCYDSGVEQTLRMLNLFEGRRSAQWQNVTVMAAAVAGALAGTALTLLFAGK